MKFAIIDLCFGDIWPSVFFSMRKILTLRIFLGGRTLGPDCLLLPTGPLILVQLSFWLCRQTGWSLGFHAGLS